MITDGTFTCALCGEWRTSCGLCLSPPLVDRRDEIAKAERSRREAEVELRQQERSIRAAAELRRCERMRT